PARLSVLAGRLWPMALLPRYAADDWLRVVQVVVSAFVESPFRAVYCRRLASPGPETGGPVQHPVAQTAEAGTVSTGFDRPVRPPSTAEDQAADRAAFSSCRGKTGA